MAKAHFWPLASQDLLGSSIRKRARIRQDRLLWFLYTELLVSLHEAGGTLPADPEALAEELEFFTPEEITRLLPLLAPGEGKRGGIVVQDGVCFNPRQLEALGVRLEFLERNRVKARHGGQKRASLAQRDELGRMLPAGESSPKPKPLPGDDPGHGLDAVQAKSSLSVPVPSHVHGGSTPDVRESPGKGKTRMSGAGAPDQRVRFEQAQEVFAYWQVTLEHPTAKFTGERRRKVEARLREGYTVHQLKRAVDGCKATPHNMGENDTGQKWDDLALICRNGSQVERFQDAAGDRGQDPQERARRKAEEDARLKAAVTAALDEYAAKGYDRAQLYKFAVEAYRRHEDPLKVMAKAVGVMTPKKPSGGTGGEGGPAAAAV